MGAYWWLSGKWKESGAVNSALKSGLWHGAFTGLAGFSVALVVMMSMESRGKWISVAANAFSTGELYPSLAVALATGVWGFFTAYRAGSSAEKRKHYLSEDWEWAETVFSAVLLASLLMYFVVQAFKIPSGSMKNTLLIGDHLFVNKFIYGVRVPFTGKRLLAFRPVERGDIIVFRFPSDDPKELHCGSIQYGKDFIKRVVGLPGDKLQVKNGQLFRNGEPAGLEPYAQFTDMYRQPLSLEAKALDAAGYQELWQTHALDSRLQDILRDQFGPVTVPPGTYMVMGDNRDQSCDSRYWGPVEQRYLKGKAWFIYWPPSRMGAVR